MCKIFLFLLFVNLSLLSYGRTFNGTVVDTFGKDIHERDTTKNSMKGIVKGRSYKLADDFTIAHQGLLGVLKEYNFVDGFHLGNKVGLRYQTNRKQVINLDLSLYYTTAREVPVWETDFSYSYSPLSPGLLSASIGHKSYDINSSTGMPRWLNSVSSILRGNNYISFYAGRYLQIANEKYIANGLQLSLAGKVEDRKMLFNQTSFNISNKTPDPNSSPTTTGRATATTCLSVIWPCSCSCRPVRRAPIPCSGKGCCADLPT